MRNIVALTSFHLYSSPEGFCQGPWQFRRGPKVWSRSRAEARGPPQCAPGGEDRRGSSVGAGLSTQSLLTRSFIFCRVCSPGHLLPPLPLQKVLLLRSVAEGRTVGDRAIQPMPVIPPGH